MCMYVCGAQWGSVAVLRDESGVRRREVGGVPSSAPQGAKHVHRVHLCFVVFSRRTSSARRSHDVGLAPQLSAWKRTLHRAMPSPTNNSSNSSTTASRHQRLSARCSDPVVVVVVFVVHLQNFFFLVLACLEDSTVTQPTTRWAKLRKRKNNTHKSDLVEAVKNNKKGSDREKETSTPPCFIPRRG